MLPITKNLKTMDRKAARWQIFTIAFLGLFLGMFGFAGSAAAIDVSIADVALAESDGGATFTFTVQITNGTVLPGPLVRFDYNTVDGSATTGDGDYASSTGSVFFNPGDGIGINQTFNVPVSGDTLVEIDENFTVNLIAQFPAMHNVAGSPATGTILNDDQYSISVDGLKQAGEGFNIQHIVTLNNDIDVSASVTLNLSDDTATTADGDYNGTPLVHVFPPGTTAGTTQMFSVLGIEDTKVEADETYLVAVTSLPPYWDNVVANGTGRIMNDDAATITISGPASQTEDSGNYVFTVTLDNPVQGGFDLAYTTNDGTASSGSDYTANAGTLNFAGTVGESYPIAVPITADTDVEADETFTVTLGALSNLAAGINPGDISTAGSPFTGTITNDDTATLTISGPASQAEGGGNYVFTVTLDNPVAGGFDLPYTTDDGTAAAGSDYTDNDSTLNFAGTAGESYPIAVPITADTDVEADETFTVALGALSNLGAGINAGDITTAGSPVTGTITDDDTATFSIDDVTENEVAGTMVFTVSVDNAVDIPVVIDVNFADVTATGGGTDYNSNALQASFGANDATPQTVSVPISADVIVEDSETFTASLSTATALGTRTVVTADTGTGTITDNNTATFTISDGTANEAAGTLDFTVSLDNAVNIDVVIDVNFADVTATGGGTDYDSTVLQTTFVAGNTADQTVSVPIIADAIVEESETFTANLSTATALGARTVTMVDTGTGTITDNNTATFAIDDVTVNEAAGTLDFTVSVNNALDIPVVIDVNFADVTATGGGTDYNSNALQASFGANDATPQTVSVPISADVIVEDSETFTASLSTATALGTRTVVTADTGTGTITDSNTATYTIDDVTVNEAAGALVFTVSVDNAVDIPVVIDVNFAGGTAIGGGTDYDSTVLQATFPAGDTTDKTVSVPIVDEAIVEANETFTAVLGTVTPLGGRVLNLADTGLGTIDNDDQFGILVDSPSAAEGTDVTFTVTMDVAREMPVDLTYTTADGSATLADSDYTQHTASVVTVPPGGASQTHTFPVGTTNDGIVELDENFGVTVSSLDSNFNGADVAGTGTITNDDFYSITIDDIAVDEDAGTATFTVSLDQPVITGDTVTLDHASADGSATAGIDYTAVGGPLTINAGSASINVNVTVNNDVVDEGDETFVVDLSNASANASIGDNQGQCTITENDYTITPSAGANGTISPNTPVFVEHGNSQTFTFTPDPGYVVDIITTTPGGIVYMSGANEYTFTNVIEDHTINVTFRAPYTVQVNLNPVAAQGEGRWRLINNTTGHYDLGNAITGWLTHGTLVTVPGNVSNVTIEFFGAACWTPPAAHDADLTTSNPYVYDSPAFGVTYYDLTMAVTGNGVVTPSAGVHNLACGTDVNVEASPDEGWVFQQWVGDVAEPLLPQTIVNIDGDKTVTAIFVENTFTLHLASSGAGSITPSVGTHDYIEGTVVNLNAVPGVDSVFAYWVGDVADPLNSNTTVAMNAEETVTAFFTTTLDPDIDHDGDGFTPNGGDCNDNDATVYPGAPEICSNGVDEDCNGLDISCDVDNDGDGYLVTGVPADCDDNDATVYPGAPEICGDGIDQDCDGSDLSCDPNDTDGDGDGYTINMGDCNDADASIYPGATEICGNGTDEDCFDGDRPCGAEIKCVDISDAPLETQVQAAPANIMFLLDDSGSMDWEFITPESNGLFRNYYYIFDNPGDNAYGGRIISVNDRRRWRSQWSGYNTMYYSAASTYTPWPNHLGPGNLPDADPNNPRSNPTTAGNTLNLSANYLSVLGGGLRVSITRENGDGTSTCADAVRFRRVSDGAEFIVDDSQLGFSDIGTWNTSSGPFGYDPSIPGPNNGGYSLYSNTGGDVAEWRTILPSTGNYEVYAWWTRAGQRAQNAPYRIYNGDGALLDTVRVNQRDNSLDGQWNLLTTVNFTDISASAAVNIINAHYYTWDDANTDGIVDNLEVYLVELNGAITYYQFNDIDGDNIVDDGELTIDLTPPASIIPQNEDGTNRTYAQERQNFANWYSFYRKRELTAKAAVGQVIDSMSGVNIGMNAINHDVVQSVLPVKADVAGVIVDDSDTLLNLLYTQINSGGGTPLRRGLEEIGRYFDDDDGQTGGIGNSPYASTAGGACQQTFAIVMTDGYYNGGNPVGTIGTGDNADGDGDTTFDGGAFGDNQANTLADIAMHYYERDLSSTLDDLVPIGGGDTARHQHMVTYTVAFGVTGSIVPSLFPDCPNTCPVWPVTAPLSTNPGTNFTNQQKIDDMYHAAVNGRGDYLSAENPQTLVDALNALQQAIEERIGSGASVAVNSQQLGSNTLLYQGLYDTNGWSGDIKAYALDPLTGVLASTYTWSAHDQLELANWDTDREIITYDGGTIGGIPFRAANLNTAGMLSLLDPDTAGIAPAMVNYLRGDNTNEQDQGGTYSFRSRSSKLGDIVHSAPILVDNVIYAGSNDGMVHAFNATTGDEIFAYVPRLVFENLNKLTIENPNYDHTYFVDKEAYFSHLGDLLVGTLGKGGKGIYCLDVTNTASAEFNAANIVKWEFPNSTDPDNSPDADLGYGFSRAFVVDSNAGPVVILGNGYQSTNHRAFLYILDAATGLLLNKIDTGAGDAVDCNGLSTPTLVDDDLDGRVDFAYAGDLLGNMWKFDLRDINAANWRVAYDDGSPQPLFQAINAQGFRQPITTAPDVMDTCENNTAGLMVVFGTGRYIGNTDFSDVSVQTFYGIWDWQQEWVNAGQSSVDKNLGSFTAARTLSSPGAQGATLAQQTMIYHGSPFGEQYRVLSSNPIDWYSPINSTGSHVGWYFDLPAAGERSVQDFVIYSNVVIAISSIPSASPCAAGGDSIIYAIDACTGGSPPGPFWDANGDGVIDSNDLINIGSAADPIMAPITGFGTPGMVYPPAIVSLNDDTALFYFGKSTGGIADGPGGGGPPAPPKGKKELTGITGWKEIETD